MISQNSWYRNQSNNRPPINTTNDDHNTTVPIKLYWQNNVNRRSQQIQNLLMTASKSFRPVSISKKMQGFTSSDIKGS
jgi:hypothetical protein